MKGGALLGERTLFCFWYVDVKIGLSATLPKLDLREVEVPTCGHV